MAGSGIGGSVRWSAGKSAVHLDETALRYGCLSFREAEEARMVRGGLPGGEAEGHDEVVVLLLVSAGLEVP